MVDPSILKLGGEHRFGRESIESLIIKEKRARVHTSDPTRRVSSWNKLRTSCCRSFPKRRESLFDLGAARGYLSLGREGGSVMGVVSWSLLVSINATVYVGGYKRRYARDFLWGDREKLNERYQRMPLRKFTSEAPLQGEKNVARRCVYIYVA